MELTVLCKVMNARVAGTWWIRNGPEIQPLNEQRDQAKLLGVQAKQRCPGEQNFLGRAPPWHWPPPGELRLSKYTFKDSNPEQLHKPLSVHGPWVERHRTCWQAFRPQQ